MWIVQELLNRLSCKSPGSVDSSWPCSPRVLAGPGHNPPGHASGSWFPALLQITEHFRQETHWNRASWNQMSVEVPHTVTLKSYTSKVLRWWQKAKRNLEGYMQVHYPATMSHRWPLPNLTNLMHIFPAYSIMINF